MSTEETTMSLCLVVEKLGSIHSFNSLSTTFSRGKYLCEGAEWIAYISVNKVGHLPCHVTKINRVTSPSRIHHQLLFALMGYEAFAKLFGVGIYTG
jgi:hypothetical protein